MKIAITGGIGAGKSHVCSFLKTKGIDVYDCDSAAKRLMANSASIRQELFDLIGTDIYKGGMLQKALLAEYLLQSEANKQAVNDIVHPAVAADFISSGLCWLESAILFDSGFYKRVSFDRVICVTAPLDVRVARIMARDHINRSKALEWVHRQMPQERMLELSDIEIVNDGVHNVENQVYNIINSIQ